MTITELRQDIYQLIDRVIETGEPIEIERKGRVVKISVDQKVGRLARLKKKNVIVGDPEDLVHTDFIDSWAGADQLH